MPRHLQAIVHPILVCGAAPNAGAALHGLLTGAGYWATLQGYLTKARSWGAGLVMHSVSPPLTHHGKNDQRPCACTHTGTRLPLGTTHCDGARARHPGAGNKPAGVTPSCARSPRLAHSVHAVQGRGPPGMFWGYGPGDLLFSFLGVIILCFGFKASCSCMLLVVCRLHARLGCACKLHAPLLAAGVPACVRIMCGVDAAPRATPPPFKQAAPAGRPSPQVFEQWPILTRHGAEILGATGGSALFSMLTTAGMARLAGLPPGVARAMVPRSGLAMLLCCACCGATTAVPAAGSWHQQTCLPDVSLAP